MYNMLFRSKRFLYSISALTVVKSPLFPLLTNLQKKVQEILYILGVLILVVPYYLALTTAFNFN